MNAIRTTSLAAALSLSLLGALAAPSAHAQDASQRIEITGASATPGWVRQGDTLIPHTPFFGLRTRAEVIAEMFAWRVAGEDVRMGDEIVRRDRFVSTHSRSQVLAEAAASRARGDFVQVGDELLPRHVAEQMGAVAMRRSSDTLAVSVVNASLPR